MAMMRLRHVPLPDDREQELLKLAHRSRAYAVKFDGVARRAGMPHITIFARGIRDAVVARFRRSSEAIAWIEAQK